MAVATVAAAAAAGAASVASTYASKVGGGVDWPWTSSLSRPPMLLFPLVEEEEEEDRCRMVAPCVNPPLLLLFPPVQQL